MLMKPSLSCGPQAKDDSCKKVLFSERKWFRPESPQEPKLDKLKCGGDCPGTTSIRRALQEGVLSFWKGLAYVSSP